VGRDDPDRLPGGLAASFVDQALLSGATFAVAAVFVALSSKTEFAVYSLIWVSIQLASSIQNAVVLTPFLANIVYLQGGARDRFIGSMGRFQLGLSLVGGVVAFAVTLLSTVATGRLHVLLAASAGIALMGGWAREFRRTRQFADLQPGRALRGDLVYVALLGLLIATGCLWQRTLTASWALSSWGIVGLISGMGGRIRTDSTSSAALWRSTLSQQVRWTLPSVVLSWIQANAYNFVALTITGIHSVADVNTARLFASPLGLLQAGWNRVFLPNAGVQTAGGRRNEAVRSGGLGVIAFAGIAVLYAAALLTVASLFGTWKFLHRITGLEALILLWMLYQFVAGARGIGTSLMVVQGSFAALFRFGLMAAVATVAAMLVTGLSWGLEGLLIAMIGGEVLLAILTWKRARATGEPRRASATVVHEPLPNPIGEPPTW
jgi:hypothetical protein